MSSISNIAVSGLNDAVTRIANAASNIVNASSTAPVPNSQENYTGFEPKDVVTVSDYANGQNLGVTSTTTPRNPAYDVTYSPSDANANAQGLVATPNVDLASEAVNAKEAQVSYSANATVIKVEKKLQDALLNIKT